MSQKNVLNRDDLSLCACQAKRIWRPVFFLCIVEAGWALRYDLSTNPNSK